MNNNLTEQTTFESTTELLNLQQKKNNKILIELDEDAFLPSVRFRFKDYFWVIFPKNEKIEENFKNLEIVKLSNNLSEKRLESFIEIVSENISYYILGGFDVHKEQYFPSIDLNPLNKKIGFFFLKFESKNNFLILLRSKEVFKNFNFEFCFLKIPIFVFENIKNKTIDIKIIVKEYTLLRKNFKDLVKQKYKDDDLILGKVKDILEISLKQINDLSKKNGKVEKEKNLVILKNEKISFENQKMMKFIKNQKCLNEANEKMTNRHLCIKCNEVESDCLFVKCQHVCLCEMCLLGYPRGRYSNYLNKPSLCFRCPICRMRSKKYIKIKQV